MALAKQEKSYFTFVKGLITEASPFTFPQNASSDESNFELQVDGSRKRRKGLDYESGYSLFSLTTASTDAITRHEWRNAAGDSAYNFIMVQVGSTLYFYKNLDAISANKKSFTVDLLTYKVTGTADATVKATPVDAAYGKGYLFVVGKYIEPIYITYNPGADTISVTTIVIKARDFVRQDPDINTQPSTLTAAHKYDLINQGWNEAIANQFFATIGSYPSNSLIFADFFLVDPTTGLRTYSFTQSVASAYANTPAPNGRTIHNVFNTNLIYNSVNTLAISTWSYVHGTTTVTVTTAAAHGLSAGNTITITDNSFTYDNGGGCGAAVTDTLNGTYVIVSAPTSTTYTFVKAITGYVAFCSQFVARGNTTVYSITNPSGITETVRFSAVGFFAGRVWFAGASSNRLSTKIYFTQILETTDQIGLCYQVADPTSDEDSDLVASDGGVINIPELGQVNKLQVVGTQLGVFVNNGVWLISGGSEDFFKATSYSIRNVSNVSTDAPQAVIDVDGKSYYVSKQGIYKLIEDKVTGFLNAESLTETTIQTEFRAIPEANLVGMSGAYDDVNKRVLWSYSSGASIYKHNKLLILDLRLGAFYKYTIPATSPYACAVIALLAFDATSSAKKFKFLTVDTTNNKLTWSDFNNASWKDWYTFNTTGTDAAAYLITGAEFSNDAMRKKQIPYFFMYMKRTETQWVSDGGSPASATLSPASSALIKFYWDLHSTSDGGKHTTAYQAYKHLRPLVAPDVLPASFTPGYDVIITKHKIRGTGRAFQVRIDTEASKDCHIYGWATTITGGTEV